MLDDELLYAFFPNGHLFFEDAQDNNGIAGRTHSAMLQGIGQFLDRRGIVPETGGSCLRHLMQRTLERCTNCRSAHGNLQKKENGNEKPPAAYFSETG